LAGLAAGADAGIECHVVADHGDFLQHFLARTDQRGALDRPADAAVFDLVGLRAGEDELAGDDVDLAAAEAGGVDALFHAAQDFLRIAVAVQHHRVGHARHGHVGEALAPAVAGGFHAHQPGVHAVLHVAGQDAVLDQHRAAGRRALVVDGERAAAVLDGAVVDHRHAGRGNALAHQAGEDRALLAVEVAFQAVADGLVQQDPGPAGTEHHGLLAGRGGDAFQIDQRLAQRLVDFRLPAGRVQIGFEAGPAACPRGARLLTVAVADDDGDVEAHQRTDIGGALAVGADDLHRLPGTGEGTGDLLHALVLRPGIGVDLLQQLHLLREAGRADGVLVAVEQAVGAGRAVGHGAGMAAAHGLHSPDGAPDGFLRQVGGMGVALRLLGDRTQPEALGRVEAGVAEATVIEGQHFRLAVLQIQLAVVHPLQRLRYLPFGLRAVEPGAGEEQLVGLRKVGHAEKLLRREGGYPENRDGSAPLQVPACGRQPIRPMVSSTAAAIAVRGSGPIRASSRVLSSRTSVNQR
jgi:hypothetical protein